MVRLCYARVCNILQYVNWKHLLVAPGAALERAQPFLWLHCKCLLFLPSLLNIKAAVACISMLRRLQPCAVSLFSLAMDMMLFWQPSHIVTVLSHLVVSLLPPVVTVEFINSLLIHLLLVSRRWHHWPLGSIAVKLIELCLDIESSFMQSGFLFVVVDWFL